MRAGGHPRLHLLRVLQRPIEGVPDVHLPPTPRPRARQRLVVERGEPAQRRVEITHLSVSFSGKLDRPVVIPSSLTACSVPPRDAAPPGTRSQDAPIPQRRFSEYAGGWLDALITSSAPWTALYPASDNRRDSGGTGPPNGMQHSGARGRGGPGPG